MNTSAEWVDRATGCREVAEFVTIGADQVYVVHHLPASGTVDGAMVICSPFFAEFGRNYRREVLLARDLARHGVAAARFHHRGIGNSTGDAALLTLERMLEDVRRVAEAIVHRSDARSLGFHGTRLAALTAAAAASGEKAPVTMWEPAISGSRYFNELFRTRMAQAVHDGETGLTAQRLRDELADGAGVDVLGHSLHPGFYASMAERTLSGELGPDGADALVVEFGRRQKALDEVLDGLQAAGVRTLRILASESESWWVANHRADYFVAEEQRTLTWEVLAAARDWVRGLGWAE